MATTPTSAAAATAGPSAAQVVARLQVQSDALQQMQRLMEEMRLRVETGDTERGRLQTQMQQAEFQRQQDLGRMQELREQAIAANAATTAHGAAGRPPRREGMFDNKGLNKPQVFDSASTNSFSAVEFQVCELLRINAREGKTRSRLLQGPDR